MVCYALKKNDGSVDTYEPVYGVEQHDFKRSKEPPNHRVLLKSDIEECTKSVHKHVKPVQLDAQDVLSLGMSKKTAHAC